MAVTRLHQPLLSTAFLRSVWANEFEAFIRSPLEVELRDRLSNWRDRRRLKETSAEQTFVDLFFRDTWAYRGAGEAESRQGFTLHPKHPIKNAGQAGGTGEADLALGWFDREGVSLVPQVLCEFKDIRSDLDTPQRRKKNNRSPVQQCKDYLWGARQGLFGNEPIIPAWGIVTDMNEFRLYWWDRMGQVLSFPPQLLRDFLVSRSLDPYFDPSGRDIWDRIKGLFDTMNEGGHFPPDKRISRFNGGLFATDEKLNNLQLTNDLFCESGQGQNEASLHASANTLLYLSAAYSYADRSDAEKTLGLYALGRIFEQSITELEMLEAEVEGRPSLNKLNKRKTNGVYYTPEWVVEKIVAETLGQRLADIQAECGWQQGKQPTLDSLNKYWNHIRRIKIVDPACGSGAFLITALRHLRDEYRRVQDLRRLLDPEFKLPDEGELVEDVLSNNIYGVDINPASLEITKLALWLHTARPNQPLSALDRHIRDGNSLIDDSFYIKHDLEQYAAEARERINAFNWREAFPEVFEQGGFDVVIGNPPYVKLQNFRKVYPDMAEYLRQGRLGRSYYESTQSGNFDLYLPFIEKGISLLSDEGRMGFIAQSLWLVNEYGDGLRKLVHRMRALDRWVDFKSYQVFEEVITYTALQFFTRRRNDKIALHQAPTGEISAIDWTRSENHIPYDALDRAEAWHLLPEPERSLIHRLKASCKRLDDPSVSRAIFVGLQTSADDIYHLKRLGPGKYLCSPGEKGAEPYKVELEDALMKPLVSGPQAKRYLEPQTDTYLLFPYVVNADGVQLIPPAQFEDTYLNAWNYLGSYEKPLRRREAYDKERQKKERRLGPFDNDEWYRFGRHQNLDKQEIVKLIVAQTVTEMRVCLDLTKRFYLNNVRVNGIIPMDGIDPWYLLGVLNAPVCDFVFRRIAAPKGGGYFEANRQYIAPLPIPRCNHSAAKEIATYARTLQSLMTQRYGLLQQLERRIATSGIESRPEHWIFPDLGEMDTWISRAPADMRTHEQAAWAKSERELALDSRYDEIQHLLHPSARFTSEFTNGELKFHIDHATPIDRVFVDAQEGPFIHAQWDFVARTFSITENAKAKQLIDALRRLAPATNAALVQQVLVLHRELVDIDRRLADSERALNQLIYQVYDLTPEEITLIEKDAHRP